MLDSNDLAIDVKNLVKIYPNKVVAVDSASFTVSRGEIFGFLGLNGAGKTTTIKILTTLIPKTSGDVSVLGFDLKSSGGEIRKRIGVVQQKESYDRNLTVKTSLRIYASLWGLRGDLAKERVDFVLDKFDLRELERRKIRWLSFGQRRRLQVGREFLHSSELLILDEPTVGLDVIARHSFLEFCKEKAKSGERTFFFTTHVVSEAEYLCNKVAIIHKGKIIALDTPSELKKRYGGMKSVSIVLGEQKDLGPLRRELEGLKSSGAIEENPTANEVRLVSDDPFVVAKQATEIIESGNFPIESVSIHEPSLEDVIFKLVGGGAK